MTISLLFSFESEKNWADFGSLYFAFQFRNKTTKLIRIIPTKLKNKTKNTRKHTEMKQERVKKKRKMLNEFHRATVCL